MGLHWHCLDCHDDEPVERLPRGEGAYALGDREPCPCGGTAFVVTLQTGARYEQGRALGLGRDAAWARACPAEQQRAEGRAEEASDGR